jgi:hypothetical protein
VESDEYHVLSDVGVDHGSEGGAAPTRAEIDDVGVANVQALREVGVQLRLWLHLGLGRTGHSAGLRAALVLRHQPAGGQDIGVVVVGAFVRFLVLDPDKVGPPAYGRKTVSEEPRRTWMIFAGAGPEDTLLRIDPFVADATVVSDATSAG